MESPEGSACHVEGRRSFCGAYAVRDGSAVRMGGGDEWLEYEGAQGFGRRGGAGQQQRQLKEAQVGRVIREETIIYPFESKNLYEERERRSRERAKVQCGCVFLWSGSRGRRVWCLVVSERAFCMQNYRPPNLPRCCGSFVVLLAVGETPTDMRARACNSSLIP